MIQIQPDDLLQISAGERFYYAVALGRIKLFGGQLCFVFFRTSLEPLKAQDLFREPLGGFF